MRTTLKHLTIEEALAHHDAGAAFVDLRPVEDYLDVHIPGSIDLQYEWGPGMPSRARDCLPLDLPLILLDLGAGDVAHAAAALRGKGFAVVGKVEDGINGWAAARGTPASTEVVSGDRRGRTYPEDRRPLILDVCDPGAGQIKDATTIPIEQLWPRRDEVARHNGPVVIAGGKGVRAALAVGILERGGVDEIVFWKP
ncbi:MAG: rhodanese-like domain-containing protein [Actinomycetota bacterium]